MTNLAERIEGKYVLSELIVKFENSTDETEYFLKGKPMRIISN